MYQVNDGHGDEVVIISLAEEGGIRERERERERDRENERERRRFKCLKTYWSFYGFSVTFHHPTLCWL
jgi:hypothetical protein